MSLTELEALPGRELDRWRAYCELEALPDPYWIGAQICAAVVNSQRAKGPAAKVEDFLPRVRRAGRRQSPEEMLAAFRAATDRTEDRSDGPDR